MGTIKQTTFPKSKNQSTDLLWYEGNSDGLIAEERRNVLYINWQITLKNFSKMIQVVLYLEFQSFTCQAHKMVKHTQTIFDHFVGLAQGLKWHRSVFLLNYATRNKTDTDVNRSYIRPFLSSFTERFCLFWYVKHLILSVFTNYNSRSVFTVKSDATCII